MDPNKCLADILDCCRAAQYARIDDATVSRDLILRDARNDMVAYLEELLNWVNRGGFLPSDPRTLSD